LLQHHDKIETLIIMKYSNNNIQTTEKKPYIILFMKKK